MLEAQVERFSVVWKEFLPLFRQNWDEEVDHDPRRPFRPNVRMYLQAEQMGSGLFISLREYDTPVGYLMGHITDDLFSEGCFTFYITATYVDPTARKALGSRRMVRMVERVLKGAGIKRLVAGAVAGSQARRLWPALGFAPLDISYVKWLEA